MKYRENCEGGGDGRDLSSINEEIVFLLLWKVFARIDQKLKIGLRNGE